MKTKILAGIVAAATAVTLAGCDGNPAPTPPAGTAWGVQNGSGRFTVTYHGHFEYAGYDRAIIVLHDNETNADYIMVRGFGVGELHTVQAGKARTRREDQ